MEKSKEYHWTKFSPEVITKAFEELKKHLPSKQSEEPTHRVLTLKRSGESWSYDSAAEFFADYRSDFNYAFYAYGFSDASLQLNVWLSFETPHSEISVSLPKRSNIEAVFAIFEDAVSSCAIPKPPSPIEVPWESKVRIFIGHGKKPLWRDLKDHLSDQHGFKVEAYEIGSRAGFTIKDILEEMLTKSSFALLVLTGETEEVSGMVHARDNVIHEVGLFQGRLGFRKAIILLEEGVSEFSNITGIHQIRFPKNSIRETFGDVVATIKREFCPDSV